MPKQGTMAQLSRPFQIALGAIVVLAAVWFLALRGHSSTSGGGSSAPPPRAAPAPKPAVPSGPYHGSAPGVAGLTRDIEKARGAVAASEQNAKELESKSAQASSNPPSAAPSAGGAAAPATATHSASSAHARHTVSRHHVASPRRTTTTPTSHVRTSSPSRAGLPSKQALVEGELQHGKTVIVLFWDPNGTVDGVVRHEVQAVQSRSTVVHLARAKEVGSFGSFTHAVQVYATPTMLIILPNGKTTTLSGLTDAYAIRQAISEARGH
jgi:hypothetical protein